MRIVNSYAGLFCVFLGLMLLVLQFKPSDKGTQSYLIPEAFSYENTTMREFAKNLEDLSIFSFRVSESVKRIEKRSSIGAVKRYPLRTVLLLASMTWDVKFILKSHSVYVCLPSEIPPPSFPSIDAEVICAEPLPEIRSIRFSGNSQMCGPNCLALLSYALGNPVSVQRVADLAGTSSETGTSMSGLAKAARSLGFQARGKRMSLDAYKKIDSPVIIHVNGGYDHYLVLQGFNPDGTFSVIDGPKTRILSENELKKQYSGHALFVWK